MTVAEWVRSAEARLQHVTESSRLEAQLLAGHTLGISRTSVLAHPEEEFPELAGESLLQRREAGEPLAYILGQREFYGRSFVVRRGVLIPRHETEVLVETALGLDLPVEAIVADVGVGSGCIAVTLKLEKPSWTVFGTDVSAAALEIARENVEVLGASVDLRHGDLLTPLRGQRLDLIVSNPPYIERSEPLAHEVRGWEPPEALFAEEDGLQFYRRLAQEAHGFLRDGGWLAVEVGYTQSARVQALLLANGWNSVRAIPDFAGIERVIVGRSGPSEPRASA